jgi:hypothetical protein
LSLAFIGSVSARAAGQQPDADAETLAITRREGDIPIEWRSAITGCWPSTATGSRFNVITKLLTVFDSYDSEATALAGVAAKA